MTQGGILFLFFLQKSIPDGLHPEYVSIN